MLSIFCKTGLARLTFLAALTFSASAFAADIAIKGYLVDVACAARQARKPQPPAVHSKGCMQLPSCHDSGFGVLTEEKKFIRFDEEGNQKARKLLVDSSKDNDFKIIVNGSIDGDTIKVSKIELQ